MIELETRSSSHFYLFGVVFRVFGVVRGELISFEGKAFTAKDAEYAKKGAAENQRDLVFSDCDIVFCFACGHTTAIFRVFGVFGGEWISFGRKVFTAKCAEYAEKETGIETWGCLMVSE